MLFKNTDHVKLMDYKSVEEIICSDHRPVYAVFKILTLKFMKEEFEESLFIRNIIGSEYLNNYYD